LRNNAAPATPDRSAILTSSGLMYKRFLPLLFVCLPAAWAGRMREFAISGLRCQALNCETREGIMPHQLTTVEVAGTAKQWAGYSLLFRVIRQNDHAIVAEREGVPAAVEG